MEGTNSDLWRYGETELNTGRRNGELEAKEIGYISISHSVVRLVEVIGDDSHGSILILWDDPRWVLEVGSIEGYIRRDTLTSLEKWVY